MHRMDSVMRSQALDPNASGPEFKPGFATDPVVGGTSKEQSPGFDGATEVGEEGLTRPGFNVIFRPRIS